MLSRSAKHLYWLARYVERTENIARMADVNLELILDFPVDHSLNWKPLIDTLDVNKIYERKYRTYNEENVLNFLFEGKDNGSSIRNCLNMAKYNIETVRDDLPKSTSIALIHLYDHIFKESIIKIHKRKRLAHLTDIVNLTQEFFSSINDNLSRGYEFEFIRLGRFLERVDMISRIIDCLCVTKSEKQTHDFSTMEWISLLTILSAQDAFRKVARGEVDRGEVISFLLKNDSFPRSLNRCLTILRMSLDSLPKNKLVLSKLKRLRSKFEKSSFEKFDDERLHLFLDTCQKDLISIDSSVDKTYFI